MKGLDGIQGPTYVGTGCVFRRQALYGFDSPRKKKPPTKTCNCWPKWCCCGCCFMGKKKKKKLKKQKFEIMENSHSKVHSESSAVEGVLNYIENGNEDNSIAHLVFGSILYLILLSLVMHINDYSEMQIQFRNTLLFNCSLEENIRFSEGAYEIGTK